MKLITYLQCTGARNYDAPFAACIMLISCLAYTLTLKLVDICSSDVDIQRTIWRYVQKDTNLHTVYCFYA
jgi:hypothetical protein